MANTVAPLNPEKWKSDVQDWLNAMLVAEGITDMQKFSSMVSSGDVKLSDKVRFFPNPANEYISLENLIDINQISILTLTGKEIISRKVETEHLTIDLGAIEPGIYFIKLVANNGETGTIKFINQ